MPEVKFPDGEVMPMSDEDIKNLETMQDILKESVVVSDKILQATLLNIDRRIQRIENRLSLPHELKENEVD